MSHHKYHTDALVVGVAPQGEGDLRVVLVTKELGMVRATARGSRLIKSKNRMSLIEGTHVRASLVKGKDMWRLTNVIFIESFWNQLSANDEKQKTAWSIHLLLRKIVPQDVLPTSLYDVVIGLWKSLIRFPVASTRAVECIVILNIVHDLGYLGDEESWQKYIGVYEHTQEIIEQMIPNTKEAIETINNSLKATHL